MEGNFEVEPGVFLHYVIDDFSDPWKPSQTLLLIHGLAESAEAWRAWVPHLARHYRVIRVDVRGFGLSTPMPDDYSWSMDRLLADVTAIAEHLQLAQFHLIGAKSGGSLVLQYAARYPAKVLSVLAMTPPVVSAKAVPEWREQILAEGLVEWARATMPARLGSGTSEPELEWWAENIQGKTPISTIMGYLDWVPGLDLREEVLKIQCPALIVTTTGSGLRSVESVKEWQSRMSASQLLVIEGDAWHAAAAYPDQCATASLAFLAGQAG